MEEISGFVFLMKAFIILTSPITFLVGVFLLFDFKTYLKVEEVLNKSYFMSKAHWIEVLEKNRDSLQKFLLRWRRVVGIICLLNAVLVVIANMSLILMKK
jgi:hypothetical protein